MPNLKAGSGAEVAETTQVKTASSARMKQVKFGDGERVFFRVATDDIITADTHRFLPVLTQAPAEMVAKAKENKKEVKWPSVMWGICPDDRIFLNTAPDGEPVPGSYEAGYGNCRVKTIFAGKKGKYGGDLVKCDRLTYVVVVLQEATYDTSSSTPQLTGLRDVTEKWVNKEGTEVTVPALRYVAQFYRSIYSAMVNAVAMDPTAGGELVGSSWMVKRDGKDYTVAPVQGAKASAETLEVYAKTLDMIGFSLGDFIIEHAGSEHYDRFWGDGSGTPAPDATAPEPDTAQAVPLDENAQLNVDAFAAKLSGQAKDAGSQPAEAITVSS